jgi:uncharacterized membrane protein YhhN
VAYLAAYYSARRAVAGVLKALPILALAWTAWTSGAARPLADIIVAGLVLSAVGDVALVFPGGFLAGLSAFFLAHLCYIGAFARQAVVTGSSIAVAVVLAGVAGGMLRYLWPYVARLRVPVTLYVAALATMMWCAVARTLDSGAATPPALAAAVGSCCFLVSDGVLAVDRFARPFAGAHAVVMATYYTAQTLIARSAL